MIKGFLLQLQFLTRVPVPVKIDFDEDTFARGVIFSSVIGLIIGLFLSGAYFAVNLTGKQIPAVIFVVFAEILITGGLHLDGLADTFDGIFSNRSKEKILEIMKDSRIGTNGTLVLIFVIMSKTGLLLSLDEKNILYYLILMPAVSRMNTVWTAGISSYARKEGMGGAIVENTGTKEIIITTGITILLCAVLLKYISLIVIPLSIIFAVLFTIYVKKKIGGITGDIIGAVIELTEIVFLFSLLISESICIYL